MTFFHKSSLDLHCIIVDLCFMSDLFSFQLKKSKIMGRVRKKVKQFCNWAFSRKSGKTQRDQSSNEGDLDGQRCYDGEAGPSNASFISYMCTGADIIPSPVPQKEEKKLKRFWKWFSRKFKKTRTRAPQSQPSSPQPQRSPGGEAACVSPRTVHDEPVNRCVSVQTPVKTPSTETERHDDTECWDCPVSSLTTAENGESDRASVHSRHSCASSPGTPNVSESDRASVFSWHSCASSHGTPDVSESDRASVLSWHSCASSLGTGGISESDRASVHSRHSCASSPDTPNVGESDRASVHSRHSCASSLTADNHNDEENASSEDSIKSEESTPISLFDVFWKTEKNPPLNLDGTGNVNQKYKVFHLIGNGSFGEVFSGIRVSDFQKVAIKYVKKTKEMKTMKIAPSDKSVPQEVGLMYLMSRGPNVPQIIQLLDWYESPEYYVLVLERPRACVDMRQFISWYDNKISEENARVVTHQVVTAANACCERGVYHSDIKLENLLINPHTLQIKLIDFGAGRLISNLGYTTFCGTRVYAPPEFFKRGRLHAKPATVYSIGVLLFILLYGRLPQKELQKIVKRTWKPEDLSKECIDLIWSCLQSKPDKRIPLEKILQHNWFQSLIPEPNNRRND